MAICSDANRLGNTAVAFEMADWHPSTLVGSAKRFLAVFGSRNAWITKKNVVNSPTGRPTNAPWNRKGQGKAICEGGNWLTCLFANGTKMPRTKIEAIGPAKAPIADSETVKIGPSLGPRNARPMQNTPNRNEIRRDKLAFVTGFRFRQHGLSIRKSCHRTAVMQLRPDENVLKTAQKTQLRKSPSNPGMCPKCSTTKYGTIWSGLEMIPLNV